MLFSKKTVAVLLLFGPLLFAVSCLRQQKIEPPKSTEKPPPPPMASTVLEALNDPFFQPTEGKTYALFPECIVRSVICDRAGDLWLASWRGVFRAKIGSPLEKEAVFENVSTEIGLLEGRAFSILETRSGEIWVGSSLKGAFRFDPNSGKSEHFGPKDGLGGAFVSCLFEDRAGRIWLGTDGGATCFDGVNFTNFSTANGLAHNSVYTITEDKKGRIWIGGEAGISIFDGNTFLLFKNEDNKRFDNVRSIIEDKNGQIWIGASGGLWRFDGEKLQKIPLENASKHDFVGCLFEDSRGGIWIGGGDAPEISVFRFDGQKFEHFTKADGLLDHSVFDFAEDRAGNIWISSARGVCRLDGRSIVNFSKP